MLTDRQLEYISDALVPLFQYLESEVIADVTQRVKATTAYTRTAEQQAQAMHALGYSPAKIRKEVMRKLNADPEYRKLVAKNTLEHKKTVRNLLKKIKKEAFNANDKIFAQVGDLSFLDDLRIWKLGNKAITDNSFLPKLIEAISMQTKGELKNLTRTTGFRTVAGMESLESLYKKELDQVMIKITSGTFSQEQALYDCIHNLANSGLRTIDFGSGRSMQLDTAVRLATRTGASQLMGQIAVQSINDTDTGMVYVSTHWGARNTGKGHANHAEWQGKVYTVNAKAAAGAKEEAKRIGQDKIEDLWEVTGYSVDGSHANDPLGLYGYNCRHRIYPWFEGISSLPDEDPEPAPVEIDGKQYDYYAMSQKQRAKESRIRALKREREAQTKAGLDTTEINKKIKVSIREYTEFCKKYGMNPTNRIRYDNGTGDYSKTRAWKEYERKIRNDNKELKVEAEQIYRRNKGEGNPSAIIHFDISLNKRQQRVLEQLKEYDSSCIVNKKDISMKDLAALTAKTGNEFAMFTRKGKRLIIRGNNNSVNVTKDLAEKLKSDGYKWSGHTHPGTDMFCLMPSSGDKIILDIFEQEYSAIYNSMGVFTIMESEDDV